MNSMKKCEICNEEFHYQSGQFLIHLAEHHNINREEYIVLTEFKENHPKCQCGYCDENAKFNDRKNKFYKINYEHRSFEWIKKEYIKKHGVPMCETCKIKPVLFHRGVPNIYCSHKCQPNNWNQKQVKETVKSRYGVDNVGKLESSKIKAKKTRLEKYGDENYVNLEKIEKTCLEKYGTKSSIECPEILEKGKKTNLKRYGFYTYSKTDKFRKESSDRMVLNNPMKNKETVDKQTETFLNKIETGEIIFFRTKQYKDTALHYQGTYEYDFLEYCENAGILEEIKNSKSFKYLKEDELLEKRHLPDFLFRQNYIIEIKSTYILEKQGGWSIIDAKKRSVESCGYVYLLILDKNMSEFIDILN